MKLPLAPCSSRRPRSSLASVASAHAHVSPPIVVKGESQVFTLAVPTEKENASTTKVELTPPAGFSIDSFIDVARLEALGRADGLRRGRRDHEGHVGRRQGPDRRGHGFEFLGRTDSAKTYTFGVRQTYSDGSVVDWTGAESSDTPAPTIQSDDSLGGGGGVDGGDRSRSRVGVLAACRSAVSRSPRVGEALTRLRRTAQSPSRPSSRRSSRRRPRGRTRRSSARSRPRARR